MSRPAFFVGTGHSLKAEDLTKIRNEFSISVNLIGLIYEQTLWRPTIWLCWGEKAVPYIDVQANEGGLCLVRDGATDGFNPRIPLRYNVLLIKSCHCKGRGKNWCHNKPFCVMAYPLGVAAQIAEHYGYEDLYLLGNDFEGGYFYKVNPKDRKWMEIDPYVQDDLPIIEKQTKLNVTNLSGEEDIDWDSILRR